MGLHCMLRMEDREQRAIKGTLSLWVWFGATGLEYGVAQNMH